jgi:hypothetical protein
MSRIDLDAPFPEPASAGRRRDVLIAEQRQQCWIQPHRSRFSDQFDILDHPVRLGHDTYCCVALLTVSPRLLGIISMFRDPSAE